MSEAAADAAIDVTESSTIKSVERAARVLGFFTVARPRMTLGEITERLGVSKATAHRYAVALRQVNLLRYDKATATYTLGPQALSLGAAARAGLPIFALSGPIMNHLVRTVDETAVLSVWDGEAPTVVRVDDGTDRVVRISIAIGARLDLTDSAQGRVFCAYLRDGEVEGLADELARSPRLERELDLIRDQGIAVNSPELHGVRTLAAPVISDGVIVAVLAVVGTAATLPADISSSAAQAVRTAAQELSSLLGE